MGINCLTNLTKRGLLQLSEQRFFLNSGVCIRSQFNQNKQQQCRAYAHNFSKLKNPDSRRPFYVPKNPHRWYSSTPSPSSSKQKVGLLAWYLGMLESRPIITKSVSSGIIYGVADLTSQAITMSPSGSFDLIRTLRMTGYGLLFLGAAQHVWYNFIGRVLPKRDIITTVKKLTIGQLTYGPFVTAVFFSYNAGLQGENGNEIAARLKRDLIPTIVNGLVYWPICDFITYKIVPVHLQPLSNSSFSYLWTIYLTYMGSLKKAVVE
ncbi:hypothetical protein LguiB_019915 [Lonicera macranthoides]